MIEFEIRLSRDHVLAATRHRALGHPVIHSLAAIYFAVTIAWDASDGRLDHPMLVALAAIVVVILVGGYLLRRRAALAEVAGRGDVPMRYRFEGESLQIDYPGGVDLQLPWASLMAVWVHTDVAMVFYRRYGYITFPMVQLPPEALAHLLEQFGPRGAVRDRRRGAR